MLKFTTEGTGILVVMLHWLGGSARTWTEVSEALAVHGMKCVALDLPGFGRESNSPPETLDETATAVIATIRSIRDQIQEPWLLAGHSMGGKLAAIIARASLAGHKGLENLQGLILVSPSPPGVEPMSESTRKRTLESLGHSTQDAARDRKHAESFVQDNVGKLPLAEATRSRTVDDILRMNRSAFVAWLTTGSKEDWSSRIGTISLPTLLLAGTEESALGPAAQREHTLPHFPRATLVPLEGGGHLAPLERPAELAARITTFVQALGFQPPWPSLSADFQALIDSDLTSPQTRAVLHQRLADDHAAAAGILSEDQLLTLRAAASRILPGCPFDLAPRIDRWLALPQHDGWRHDNLPADADAWRTGLHSLLASALREHGVPFIALDPSRQDALLSMASKGKLGRDLLGALHLGHDPCFTAVQMRDWFGDLHAELTRIYIADPRTMNRIGFTGFADEHGFTQIRLDQQEDIDQ